MKVLIEDEKSLYAIVRCFEIIGEAVKNIPEELTEKYGQIPWKDMAGMRNKLINEYFGIDYEILWEMWIFLLSSTITAKLLYSNEENFFGCLYYSF